ncbi:hypothetical protein B0H11DRAFT_2038630 [Mycena galericulata]|nr:hypothetical protein B0H11DRAFT_2038630 [Mycena galericulata]
MHPEGALYYVHNSMNIFTDAPLHEKLVFESAMSFIRRFEEFRSSLGIPRDPVVDLVLDLITDKNGEHTCGYYLADHKQRIIFWHDSFELKSLARCFEVYGPRSPQHINLELTAQYWYHCTLFPSTLPVTQELVRELRDTVIFRIGDSMTAATSTAPYSIEDLLKMLTVVESVKENSDTDYGGTSCIISRFMWIFACNKFYNFHGEPCARLEKNVSVFGNVQTRSLLFRIIAAFTFNAPSVHLRTLDEVYVDELLNLDPWRRFIDTLCLEWQELILFASVLLNADMAFLAIPTVDNGLNISARSISQIASYFSVVASLGSIIVGLILVRQYRPRRDDPIDVAAQFMGRHFRARFGLESLASLYSLPFALLMWGTIAFSIAFLVMCFQSSDTSARTLVAFSACLVAFSILWCFQHTEIPLLKRVMAKLKALQTFRGGERTSPENTTV